MHSVHVRVRYSETDQMGVVYHAHYLVYCEIGRTELLRRAGGSYRDFERLGLRLPVIEAGLRFRKPARYDDVVAIETRLGELTGVRMRFDYQLRLDTGALLADGHTVHACMDAGGKPRRLPPAFREALERLLARSGERGEERPGEAGTMVS